MMKHDRITRRGTLRAALAMTAFCVGTATVAEAQGISSSAPATGVQFTPRPPIARQIEPMVAPIKRVEPKVGLTPDAQQFVTGSLLAPAAPWSAGTKYVVHTCRIGQDYSEKRKTCYTPGVTKVVGIPSTSKAARKAARAKVAKAIAADTSGRSALGAKRKR